MRAHNALEAGERLSRALASSSLQSLVLSSVRVPLTLPTTLTSLSFRLSKIANLGALASLRRLMMHGSEVHTFPPPPVSLPCLQYLEIGKVVRVRAMPSLRGLSLHTTRSMPDCLAALPSLEVVGVYGRPKYRDGCAPAPEHVSIVSLDEYRMLSLSCTE